jgi:lysophospholipase L1-like esterase
VASATAAASSESLRLSGFCAALHRLGREQGAEHVRVLWLGDSHTYADFLTHAVRTPLQRRYGNGGPGYLHLGIERYRHGGIKSDVEGKWRLEPESPSRSSRWGDGVFGLGGMRTVPVGSRASVEARLLPGAVASPVEYVLWFRLPRASAGFSIQVDDGQPQPIDGTQHAAGTIASLRLAGGAGGRLRLGRFRGEPELFGVAVESQKPGVVLDTLGINGARAATPLGWDETEWVPLVGARKPALAVLAYGTNEVFADTAPARYAAHYRSLMGRIRRAQPNVECLLLGPTDVPQEDGTTRPRVLEIDDVQRRVAAELGCAFVSLHQAMGGPGSFGRWAQQEPPLAARDHVHLTPKGYERLGQVIADRILTACR